jgi:hypothetical protein
MAENDTKDQGPAERRSGKRQLAVNVHVVTEDNPAGAWFGPDYPEAGDPPAGSVHDGAYEGSATEPAELASLMELEGAAEDDREPTEDPQGPDGAELTGDRHRTSDSASNVVPRVTPRRR